MLYIFYWNYTGNGILKKFRLFFLAQFFLQKIIVFSMESIQN